jgi:hypothetical protein
MAGDGACSPSTASSAEQLSSVARRQWPQNYECTTVDNRKDA